MGSFVDRLNLASVGIGNPWNEITETVDYTRAYADDMRVVLNDQIEAIANAVGQYTPSFDNISDDLPTIDRPGFPSRPVIDTELNTNWPENTIPDPLLVDVSADFSFVEPLAPDEIDPSFDYVPGAYDGPLMDELVALIKTSLSDGGTGLTDAVYAAIITRNKEARTNAEEAARRKIANAVGSRGFNLPGGMMAAALLEFEKDVLAKDLDAVNSTTIKDFELADGNTKFSKQLSLDIEKVLQGKYASDEDRLFNIAKVSKDLIIAIYEQNVKIYLGKWEGVRIKIDAAKTSIEALIAKNDGEIKVFQGRSDVYKTKVEAIAAENKSRSDSNLAISAVYESEVRAVSAEYSALVEEVKVSMEQFRIRILESIEQEKINLDAFSSASALAEKIAESIANIASQSVASALGAINTTMSYGYSGSTSKSESSNVGNSLNESHSYSEA